MQSYRGTDDQYARPPREKMNDTSGISRKDIEDFRYSCLLSSDRKILDELRMAPVYQKLLPARVPDNTPIGRSLLDRHSDGRRRGHGKNRRKSSHFQYHHESHELHEGHEHLDGREYSDDDYDEYVEGHDLQTTDPDVYDEYSRVPVNHSSRIRFPSIDEKVNFSRNGNATINRHHVTGIESTERLPEVDRLVVRKDIESLDYRDSLENSRIASANNSHNTGRNNGQNLIKRNSIGVDTTLNSRFSSKSKRTNQNNVFDPDNPQLEDDVTDNRPHSQKHIDRVVRNASFASRGDGFSRQHTRDGFYSRQNSRLTDSSRKALKSDSSRRKQRNNAERRQSTLVKAITDRGKVGEKLPPTTIPLSEMTFWQRLELFKKAQRNAYTNALNYAQIYQPNPDESWMFGHRIHRAFVFSYFGAPEKIIAQPDGQGKKKKKKRKKGKSSEMKSIFGNVMPHDYYPGGKMNVDGSYNCDYRQVKV